MTRSSTAGNGEGMEYARRCPTPSFGVASWNDGSTTRRIWRRTLCRQRHLDLRCSKDDPKMKDLAETSLRIDAGWSNGATELQLAFRSWL
jgi:hypothetical protein